MKQAVATIKAMKQKNQEFGCSVDAMRMEFNAIKRKAEEEPTEADQSSATKKLNSFHILASPSNRER